jgi:hypothetical protein
MVTGKEITMFIAMKTKHWEIVNDVMVYDYDAIEADLIRLGATPEEAASLATVLCSERSRENWGTGAAGNFTDNYMRFKLWAYRGSR